MRSSIIIIYIHSNVSSGTTQTIWQALQQENKLCSTLTTHSSSFFSLNVSFPLYYLTHSATLNIIIHQKYDKHSALIHPANHLTSNKNHCSSQSCFLVVITDDVGSSWFGGFLMYDCGGVTSPTKPCHFHDAFAIGDVTKDLPLLHNATEGGVGPCKYNFVLGVHLEILIARQIIS